MGKERSFSVAINYIVENYIVDIVENEFYKTCGRQAKNPKPACFMRITLVRK